MRRGSVSWICRLLQRSVDRLQQKLRRVAVFVRIGDAFEGLFFTDLFRQCIHAGFDQRIHGCDSLAQIDETDGKNIGTVHDDLHICMVAAKLYGGGIFSGQVQGGFFVIIRFRDGLFGQEGLQQQKQQPDA